MMNLPSLDLIGGPVEGLVCIVTGPTSGIGKETATELARRGAHGKLDFLLFTNQNYIRKNCNALNNTFYS
jgi:hypothetical protein